VNWFGQIVGRATDGNLQWRACVWNPTAPAATDLNEWVLGDAQTPAQKGWTLTEAIAINDQGAMIGQGFYNGQPRAWLLIRVCQ
jgi:hypothetical protein